MSVRRLGIVCKRDSAKAQALAGEVSAWCAGQGIATNLDEVAAGQDAVIILGGDGTLLHVAEQASALGIPVLGVNLGGLGFLTEVAADGWRDALAALVAGRLQVEERMMVRARLHGEGGASAWALALNDVVLSKGNADRLVRLNVWHGDEFVASYRADGLVFATPTGSTAYNLSAGGPIVHPGVRSVTVTPICPFMLESRPILLPADRPLFTQLEKREAAADVKVMVDGRFTWAVGEADRLEITAAPQPLRLVCGPVQGYFEILRTKLNWGGRAPCRG